MYDRQLDLIRRYACLGRVEDGPARRGDDHSIAVGQVPG